MPRVIITVPDRTPQPYRFQLDRQVVMIGRGSDNDIAVDCSSMSVRHAEMLRVEGGYKLRDLGSTNGIKLDDQRYEVLVLRHGAVVKLGDVAFDFQLSELEREVLSRENPLDDASVLKPEPKPDVAAAQAADAPAEPKKKAAEVDGGGGFMIFLLLLLFAVLAFFGGLALRHYIQTGGSLIEAMQSKTKTLKANREGKPTTAPAPAPGSPTAPAPEPTAPVAPEPAAPAPAAPVDPAPAAPVDPAPAAPVDPAPAVPETPAPAPGQ